MTTAIVTKPKRRTLWDIGEDLEALEALLIEAGGDITDEQADAAIDVWLNELGLERDRKLDGYAHLVTELTARADMRKRAAQTMTAMSRVDANVVERLKARVLDFFQLQHIKRVDTEHHRFSRCGNGGPMPVELRTRPDHLPAHFQIVTVTANTDALRKALEAGDEEAAEHARLGERGEHVRIR